MPYVPREEAPSWAQERAELKQVLGSEVFRRATRPSQLLKYICEQTFNGRPEALKEYTIAVEALGRPASFDHARDAIVRVEAHRLRKRLDRFYSGEGAGNSLRLEVPPGAYVPVFRPVAPAALPPDLGRPRSAASRWPWFVVAALTAIIGGGAFLLDLARSDEDVPTMAGGTEALRFSAGHRQFGEVDGFGRRWMGESYFQGGEAVQIPEREIQGAWYSPIHFWQRRGEFRYDIPLEPGSYQVSLYFASLGGQERNLFNVYGNGRSWLEAFDVAADAGGPHSQTIRTFAGVTPSSDGHLHLDFQPLRGQAMLSAVEILPTADENPLPIRLLAGRLAHIRDETGWYWSADRYVEGGRGVLRNNRIIGTDSPNLFGGERWGDFRYMIPVADARYHLRLYFAETWFGKSNSQPGGEASRIFDVYLQGKPLLLNFDVFAEAGGENRMIVKEFHDVQPNGRSLLELEFRSQPRHNFAMVNAIEILAEDGMRPAK